jgi:1-acyl-sn-glycerol-3-phosphate acyltransferase
MLRTVFAWVCIAISTVIIGILAWLSGFIDRSGRLGHRVARLWGKSALWAAGARVRVEGLDRVPGEGPYIFMPNHQGMYDIFALLGHLPFEFKWLAKKELFSIPILGRAMAATGYISIDRTGTRETVEAMNDAARKIRDGVSVVLFPEGSRSPDGSIQPFKKGGFSLALKSGVPIVPVAISGSREIIPKDSYTIRPGEIRIRIAPPVQTREKGTKDRSSLMEEVREELVKEFAMISRRNGENRS